MHACAESNRAWACRAADRRWAVGPRINANFGGAADISSATIGHSRGDGVSAKCDASGVPANLRARAINRAACGGPCVGERIVVGIAGIGADHNGVAASVDHVTRISRAGRDWRMIGRGRRRRTTEPENHTGLIAEVALVVVAGGEGIAEPCEQIVKLHRPEGHMCADGNVEPPPMMKSKALLLGEVVVTVQRELGSL